MRFVAMFVLFVSVVAAARGQELAGDPAGNDTARIVARADPAIACILVSRSDWYRKLGHPAPAENSGHLGGFDGQEVDRWFRLNGNRFEFDALGEFDRKRSLRLRLDLADPLHIPEAFGTGIVIDAQGLILTNFHVVQDATKIFVRLPGGKGSYADIHAADARIDLAVLRLLDPKLRPLTTLPLGNADKVQRGQPVIALANPYAAGLHDGQPSVSTGVISNVRRRVPGRQPLRESMSTPFYQYGILLQTDARLVLGSSGGALLDTRGECLGITTALAAVAGSDAQGGFALPMTTHLRTIVEVLRRGEEVEYGFLGVGLSDDSPGIGATIKNATFGTPAQMDAHLQPGDVVTAIDGVAVRDNHDLILSLGLYLAGDRIHMVVRRGGFGKEQRVDATLAKFNLPTRRIYSSLGRRPYLGGLRVDYTSVLAKNNIHSRIPTGVLVSEIQPGSKAKSLDLLPYDVITHVGGVPVTSPPRFYEEMARQRSPIELRVLRSDNPVRVMWK